MMTIAQIMEKMIAFSEGNIHDITHLSCVWTYAKTIGVSICGRRQNCMGSM